MIYRTLGKTGYKVSEISLGTWQLGSRWGDEFNDEVAQQTLQSAVDNGITLFDTADIYQDRLSEPAIGRFLYGSYYELTKSIEDNPEYNNDRAQRMLRQAVERDPKTIQAKAEVLSLI